MSSCKKSPNRVIAEAIEVGFCKRVSVRKNVRQKRRVWADAHKINPHEWEYNSTVCPGIWDKKTAERIREAVKRALELLEEGRQFVRVLLVPRDFQTGENDFFGRVAPALDFFVEVGRWLRRVNAQLESWGISVDVAARHAGIINGELRPHLHLLVSLAPGLKMKPAQIRHIIAHLLGEVGAVIETPAPRVAGFIKKPRKLAAYVSYLHKYPITCYLREGKKGDIREVVEGSRDIFLAALTALTCRKFTLKGTVVCMGCMRLPSVSDSSSVKERPGPIHAEFGRDAEALPMLQEGQAEMGKELAACCATPQMPQPDPEPAISLIITRPHAVVEGLEVTVALLEGCWDWSREKIEDRFPLLGERWEHERAVLWYVCAGYSDAEALRLARAAVQKETQHMPSRLRVPRRALVEVSKERLGHLVADAGEYMRELVTRAQRAGRFAPMLALAKAATQPMQLALPAPNYGAEACAAAKAALETTIRKNRRAVAAFFSGNPHKGKGVIITPPASGGFPMPNLLSFASTHAQRVAEIRAEIRRARAEVKELEKKASARLRRNTLAA
jgi:hypothetical protein